MTSCVGAGVGLFFLVETGVGTVLATFAVSVCVGAMVFDIELDDESVLGAAETFILARFALLAYLGSFIATSELLLPKL